jgi:hypothetical protein
LQNYKNAVTPAEAGVQKPLNPLDSCPRIRSGASLAGMTEKSNYDTFARGSEQQRTETK